MDATVITDSVFGQRHLPVFNYWKIQFFIHNLCIFVGLYSGAWSVWRNIDLFCSWLHFWGSSTTSFHVMSWTIGINIVQCAVISFRELDGVFSNKSIIFHRLPTYTLKFRSVVKYEMKKLTVQINALKQKLYKCKHYCKNDMKLIRYQMPVKLIMTYYISDIDLALKLIMTYDISDMYLIMKFLC